jgi:tetratricopeptide (TPR) repeat protein
MQDEIVARLANALNPRLLAAEARRAERKPNPDSTDLCFQGWAWRNKGVTPDHLVEARRLFERAAALDSANAFALIGLASVDIQFALSFLTDDRDARLAAAEEALTAALTIAPESALAHLLLGVVQMHTNRASHGVASCERALDLDPNLAAAHAQIGDGKFLLGEPSETEGHINEALRLSPRDQQVYLWCMFAGLANFHLGREEEAVVWLRRSIDANRNHPSSRFIFAAALARIGRLSEARSELRAGLATNPGFTIARFRAGVMDSDPPLAAGWERYVDGLRKAGAPEE